MKKITIVLLSALSLSLTTYAQDAQQIAAQAAAAMAATPDQTNTVKPSYWKNSIDFTLGFNQTSLTNWAAGGYNTINLSANIDAKANYAKGLMSWGNRMQLDYGFLWSADKSNLLQKSNDRIYLESKWGYKTGQNSKWSYSASFDFRSQFSNSFDNYQKDETGKWSGDLKSGFISPAYTNIALGMSWKPKDWFDVSISPLTGGFTICTIDELRKNYGMPPANEDGSYKSSKFQFGAQIKINFKLAINEVFVYETQIVAFTDYLDNPFKENRINWDNKVTWKMAKYFKIGLDTWLIYDPNITINDKNGIPCTSLTQFKESLGISFIYTIASKK